MVVIAAVGSCVVISFLLSFLRWTWVTACLILAVIFTLASFLGLATGEINFSPSNKAALCVTAIAATITGACGLLLSIARHQQ